MTTPALDTLKDFARAQYAWPGGYQQHLVMRDGETLCHACTKANYRLIYRATVARDRSGWDALCVAVHWEGEPLQCAHCNAEIESEYGVPDTEEN